MPPQRHKPIPFGRALFAEALGTGALTAVGVTGTAATVITAAAGNVAASTVGTVVGNVMSGQPPFKDLGRNILIGAVTDGAIRGGGAFFRGVARGFGSVGSDAEGGLGGAGDAGEEGDPTASGCNDSFQASTLVTTPHGQVPIASLHVGNTVQAVNPATKQVQSEPVQAVHVHVDSNLLDVTLAPVASTPAAHTTTKQQQAEVAAHGAQAPPNTETLHTTTEHPFLTQDRGFVPALLLRPGERVQRLDGTWGTVLALHVRSGMAVRYNLTVAQDHTFAVGADQWIVHNICTGNTPERPLEMGKMNLRHFPNFDAAREAAQFDSGMIDDQGNLAFDPSDLRTKVDPATGTEVEFQGPDGELC